METVAQAVALVGVRPAGGGTRHELLLGTGQLSVREISMNEHPNTAIIQSAYEAVEKGDVAAYVALLDDDIIWHESTPGMEGDYHGRDQVLAFLGQVFQETGMQMSVSIHDILANDDHAVILHESTLTLKDRTLTAKYADVYHLRNGKITEHWHLAVNPKAEEEFFTS